MLVLACGTPLLLNRFLQGSETFRTIVLSPPPQSPPAAPSAPAPAGAPQAPRSTQTLATEDVATLIDVWRSVTEQTNSTIDNTNQIEKVLSSWPKQINEERSKLVDELNVLRNEINNRKASIATLGEFYQRFPNIREAIRDGNSDGAFARLYTALNFFIIEIGTLPAKLPQNFESLLKPYADEVKLATTALAKWANDTHSFSETQVRELSTAK